MPSWEWDAAQRAVLDLPIDASAAVVGGPGSGKTAVLVARAAAMAADGVAADEFLVLTPTRASASLLRDVLGVAVPVASPGPLARSAGSFAFQIVRADAVRRGLETPRLLTGADQDRIVADLLAGDAEDEAEGAVRWPAHLGAPVRATKGFRSELRQLLAQVAELGVSPDELAALGSETWTAVAGFLRDYETVRDGMRSPHRDVSELFAQAAAIVRGGGAVPGLERLRAVLVDDAQELTRGGVGLVEALVGRGVAVVAFGDPDIGSGAFRGVAPELFARLAEALGARLVLREPHRSAPGIARLVRTATQSIGAAGVVAHRQPPGPPVDGDRSVAAVLCGSPYEEVDRIARALRGWHLDEDMAWSGMAVIAHDTRQVAMLEAELAAREVPTRAAGVQRPLGSESAVRDIVEVVRLGLLPAAERADDALLDALRSPFGGLDGVGLRRLRAHLRHAELAAGGTRPARELLRDALAHPVALDLVDTGEARTAARFARTLAVLHDDGARGATIHELLWTAWERARTSEGRRLERVWHELSLAQGPLAAEAGRALDGLVALFASAKRSVERNPHEGPLPFIREILDSDVPEDTLSSPDRDDAVALLTPANALGVEYDAVVIAGVQDGVWPNLRLRGGLLESWRFADAVDARRAGRADVAADVVDRRRAALHDELRLFARAASRARRRLFVTAVDDDDTGPSPLFALLPAPDPLDEAAHPLTLRGLVAHHRRTLTSGHDASARAEAAGQLRALAAAGVVGADPHDWYGVAEPSTAAPLRDLDVEPARVSPSRLEAFEECGLGWAISSLGGDTATAPSAGIGTILHAAMERHPDGDLAGLRAVVDERWGELDFETPWIARKERRRADQYVERLHAYLREVARDGGRTLASEAEFRFGVDTRGAGDGEPAVVVGDAVAAAGLAVVRGSIDRVEAYPPGGGEHAPARGPKWTPMPDGERVVVVDLKSGKSESRTSEAAVAEHAQLAAYQIAVQEGLVPGADPAALAGARLAIVSQTLAKSEYRVAHQHALGPESRAAFLERVVAAARGMSAASFTAQVEDHCADAQRVQICRIHTIEAVSA
ncbi:PD-(D/E)XK nuclease family protein [Microbacterium sp. NPDC055683]